MTRAKVDLMYILLAFWLHVAVSVSVMVLNPERPGKAVNAATVTESSNGSNRPINTYMSTDIYRFADTDNVTITTNSDTTTNIDSPITTDSATTTDSDTTITTDSDTTITTATTTDTTTYGVIIADCPAGCACRHVTTTELFVDCGPDYAGPGLPAAVPALIPSEGRPSYVLSFRHSGLAVVDYRPYLNATSSLLAGHNAISHVTLAALSALSGGLKRLHLDHNALRYLPDNISSVSLEAILELRLGNNPWDCACAGLEGRDWLLDPLTAAYTKDSFLLRCATPWRWAAYNMADVPRPLWCSYVDGHMSIYIAIVVVFVFSFLSLTSYLVTLLCINRQKII